MNCFAPDKIPNMNCFSFDAPPRSLTLSEQLKDTQTRLREVERRAITLGSTCDSLEKENSKLHLLLHNVLLLPFLIALILAMAGLQTLIDGDAESVTYWCSSLLLFAVWFFGRWELRRGKRDKREHR
jgi:hypothetical protein